MPWIRKGRSRERSDWIFYLLVQLSASLLATLLFQRDRIMATIRSRAAMVHLAPDPTNLLLNPFHTRLTSDASTNLKTILFLLSFLISVHYSHFHSHQTTISPSDQSTSQSFSHRSSCDPNSSISSFLTQSKTSDSAMFTFGLVSKPILFSIFISKAILQSPFATKPNLPNFSQFLQTLISVLSKRVLTIIFSRPIPSNAPNSLFPALPKLFV